ncbi:hypothetical protein E4U52_000799, partial [Claviceps spartinae]
MENAATGAMRMSRHSLAGKARWLTTAANSLATHHSPQPAPGAATSTMPPGF